ncbi:MAG: HlyC/CorC family transporter [Rhodospirillales bacterium]|nr:HlyC/CorC family transporter [Rhodospirillales bacterium]
MDTGLLFSILAVLLLLVLSGFFSGSETALTAVSRARMHALAKDGNKRAAMVNDIRERKERMIGALLLGNNLVNILATALSTSILITLVGEAGVFYATIAMTLLVLIFAEVLPKTYTLHHADQAAMAIAPIIRVIVFVFAPVTQMVSAIVRLVLKMFGVDISVVAVGSNVEELRGVIEMHQGEDEEVQEQRAMLRSILDLPDVDVGEIMVHRKNVIMIDAGLPIDKLVEVVLDSPYTRLPLWKDDPENIVGVIHVKTLLKEMQSRDGQIGSIKVEDFASEPWFVPETTTLSEQLKAFRQRREHFALVVDEYGSLKGVVTLEDIIEEIVGEVEDEYDERVAGVRRQSDGSYLAEGTVTIRDLNREFEWNLPSEDYSTIAGLILHESQMIPDAGQRFTFFGFQFDVVRRQRNQITLVRVVPPAEPDKG